MNNGKKKIYRGEDMIGDDGFGTEEHAKKTEIERLEGAVDDLMVERDKLAKRVEKAEAKYKKLKEWYDRGVEIACEYLDKNPKEVTTHICDLIFIIAEKWNETKAKLASIKRCLD